MRRTGPDLLRWLSIGLLLGSLALTFFELIAYSRQRARLPQGMSIASVPVGGLDHERALERLLQTYSEPVELHYLGQIIMIHPASIGFRLDHEAMLAAAEFERTGTDFWAGFWDFMWNRPGEATTIPIRAEHSASQLESVLRDIAARYDEPPLAVQPVPGSPNFAPGEPGRVLDIGRASQLVVEALGQPSDRRVNLPVVEGDPPRPTLETLATLIKQNVDVAGFDGLVDFFLTDLQTGDELHFAYFRNGEIAKEPDIAFTAASIIKIGIMTAYLRYFDPPFDPEAERWLAQMITQSGNDPADWLMGRINVDFGPLSVTDTLRDLGLESSFIVGYFHPPPVLLSGGVPRTPGNQRLDINTRPDVFNQTTPSEIGSLLTDIYLCQKGGGALIALFPEEIKPEECRLMLDLLAQNNIGLLLEAGVPDGTRVAHKHGWTESPLTSLGDAGVIYTPGGDFVLSMFFWNDREMVWEPTSHLFAVLTRAVYNYFNPPSAAGG
ncbi:MAG: serine hydrolase [Anaerolineales bacterium]